MTPKEYLMQIPLCNAMIDEKLREVERLYELMERITATYRDDGAGGGGYTDKIGNAVSRIIDLKASIDRQVDRYADIKAYAYSVLARMENADHVKVLTIRYFDGEKSWDRIAEKLCYSKRGVQYLHGRALEEFGKVMGKREK